MGNCGKKHDLRVLMQSPCHSRDNSIKPIKTVSYKGVNESGISGMPESGNLPSPGRLIIAACGCPGMPDQCWLWVLMCWRSSLIMALEILSAVASGRSTNSRPIWTDTSSIFLICLTMAGQVNDRMPKMENSQLSIRLPFTSNVFCASFL